MIRRPSSSPSLLLLLLFVFVPLPAASTGDRLVTGSRDLRELTLPDGGVASILGTLEIPVEALAVRTGSEGDEQLIGIRQRVEIDVVVQELVEIMDDAEVSVIGSISPGVFDEIVDLAVDEVGRLWLLTNVSGEDGEARLVELDPENARILGEIPLDVSAASAIARAPLGLWLVVGRSIHFVDPETGARLLRWEDVLDFWGIWAASADTSGALWMSAEAAGALGDPDGADPRITPPTRALLRFDPTTGELIRDPDLVNAVFSPALAVRRRCPAGPTTGCLQGGRFLAEVEWTDFQGATGPGRLVPGQSADSALFSFFSGSNWELLVKVLDGCEVDDRFWVFAAGTTNVGYTLRVTDLETGERSEYRNPLGVTSPAVTDTDAFASCP